MMKTPHHVDDKSDKAIPVIHRDRMSTGHAYARILEWCYKPIDGFGIRYRVAAFKNDDITLCLGQIVIDGRCFPFAIFLDEKFNA